ncbi:putrescine ABC superfamily ATP binding cassette transporter, ABC protein [Neisseria shayeganii 871]|uniref:Spermidine/putrescine import ATP-binding protein PotA n=2 Tax=Neisseria shayeganii TaxID=607712 RepID=G4CGW8_9NEIS|nr:putrescine ABC superfamily ATP binding cassette transporter, ABC protein [Neisseria shayeganii 871]
MQCKGGTCRRLLFAFTDFTHNGAHATMTEKHSGATQAAPYLQIQGLVKTFGDQYAVDHVDLSIDKHEIFALLGSSGSGKSTLLRMLAGMETPTQGKIILDGQDITHLAPYERPINMMFQSYALFPHMTVEQNIAFGLKQDKMPKEEIAARVEEMLRLVQMSKYAKRKPHQLSGGQQQRVALARSLAKRPKLLLLDEPLGALDKKLRQQTQLELVNTLEEVGVTCIMVTHDQEEAMTMATRIAIMSEGQLQQVGTPSEIYDFPNSRFTAEFIGETNIFEGKVVVDEADHAEIACGELEHRILLDHGITGPEDQTVWVSIRPEDINMHKAPPAGLGEHNRAAGTVEEIAYLGSFAIYHVRLPSGRIIKSQVPSSRWYLQNETPPTWEETVYLSWPANQPVPLTR